MEEKLEIKDESGDREYFTIVPNYVLNHSTHTDQALYLQMKRCAGEDGKCFATQETLTNKLGIGRWAYKKSLNYLLKMGWVEFVGLTGGKTRPIKTYKINNIWQENSDYYKKIPSGLAVTKDSVQFSKDTVQISSKIPSGLAIEEEPSLRRTIKKREGNFIPPSLEEITDYCKERKNNIKPQSFIDFYSSKGWMIGKNKMKDWKAAIRTWESRSENKISNINDKYKGL